MRLLRMIVHRAMFVEPNVGRLVRWPGVIFGFRAEAHEPSCGGGLSALLGGVGPLPDALVGRAEVFFGSRAEAREPSCGGGLSSLLSEFGPMPNVLLRKVEFWTTRCPPAF